MSTRCITIFKENGKTVGTFYRHHDGYPEGQGYDLRNFLTKEANSNEFMEVMAKNFLKESNNAYPNKLEVRNNIQYNTVSDILDVMRGTDWEYAYLVERPADGDDITLTITNRTQVLFKNTPDKLDDNAVYNMKQIRDTPPVPGM